MVSYLLHHQEEMPFGNEIFLSKSLAPRSFMIYMVIWVFLQNSRIDCLLSPAPSVGRRPLVTPFGDGIYLSKSLAPCSFRIYMAIGVYLQSIMRLYGFFSKTLELIACHLLHLQ